MTISTAPPSRTEADGRAAQDSLRSIRLARTILDAQHRNALRPPPGRNDCLRLLNAILENPTKRRNAY